MFFDQHQLIPIPILDIRVRIILSLDSRPPAPAPEVYEEQAAAAARTSGARCTQASHTPTAPTARRAWFDSSAATRPVELTGP